MPIFGNIDTSINTKREKRMTWKELKSAIEDELRKEKIPESVPVYIEDIIIDRTQRIGSIVIRVEADERGSWELMVV